MGSRPLIGTWNRWPRSAQTMSGLLAGSEAQVVALAACPPPHTTISADKATASLHLNVWAAESWYILRWYILLGHYTFMPSRKVRIPWFWLPQTRNLSGGNLQHLAGALLMHQSLFSLLDVRNRLSGTQTLYLGRAVANSKHLPALKAVNCFAAKSCNAAFMHTCSLLSTTR